MGHKYEVSIWTQDNLKTGRKEYFHYEQVYYGEWLPKAILVMIHAKVSGVGCVKLEWR